VSQFNGLRPSLLIFLHRLRRLSIVDRIGGTLRHMERRDRDDHLVDIICNTSEPGHVSKEITTTYLIAR
jgi:hypothetical protein